MNVNILLRGQSNAIILGTLDQSTKVLTNKVQQWLGFDGVNDTVTLHFQWNQGSNNTATGGTSLIGDWLTQSGSGWQNNTLEQGLLGYVNAMAASQKDDPTVVLWLHNEYDSSNANLTSATWQSAVRYDAAQVRAAFGQAVEYIFVEPIPYPSGTDAGAQAIRAGMEALVADSSFKAEITASTDDLDMDTVVFGAGGHMSTADATLVADRAARTIAEAFAAYAKAGSPVANASGNIDDTGPLATGAVLSGARQLTVTFQLDAASSLAALDADAAAGLGWSVRSGGTVLQATSATLTGANTVVLGFNANIPAGATLYYGYGNAQLEANGTAHGNAVYDNQGVPARTPAAGLAISGGAVAAAGALLTGGSGADTLAAGANGDTIVGGAGNDYLVAGAGADKFVVSRGDGPDWIDGFTPGVDHLSFGDGIRASDIRTQATTINGVNGLAVFYNSGSSDFAFLARVSAISPSDLLYTHHSVGVFNSSIVWRGAGNEVGVWQMSGAQVASVAVAPNPGAYWTAAGVDDLNGDGRADILWRGQGGEVAVWGMNGAQVLSADLVANPGSYWTVAGTGDVNGDGRSDIFWRGQAGEVAVWGMDGARIVGTAQLQNPGTTWTIAGVDDFNGDGRADILWRGQGGEVGIWQMNGGQIVNAALAPNPGNYWTVAGTGDVNGDGRADIIWRGQAGEAVVWGMDGVRIAGSGQLPTPGGYWTVAGLGDVNGDGKADIIWRGQGNEVGVWEMNGAQLVNAALAPNPGSYWTIA